MTEDNLKQYVQNGGELFRITFIDTIRDGGTKYIKTTKGEYYIGAFDSLISKEYGSKDIISDNLFKEFLLMQIEKYEDLCKFRAEDANILYKKIRDGK